MSILPTPSILLVEDDIRLAELVSRYLETHGCRVSIANRGNEVEAQVARDPPDLIILDLGLPDADGMNVCRQLRVHYSNPILILTARESDIDHVLGLELGADDFLTKPFSPRTLLARIKALLRRAGMENTAPLAAGRITLDIEEHTVQIGQSEPVRLTKLELRLLQMLLANAGHTVSSDRLLIQVWGHRNSGDRQLLKQLVHRLRQKIEADPATPQLLQTASGAGYKLVVD